MKKLLIASTSTLPNSEYLSYLLPELSGFFHDCKSVLFIPFARPGGISYAAYTKFAQKGLSSLGIDVRGIHEFENPQTAFSKTDAIFTGGGNTFVLVNELYRQKLMVPLADAIKNGKPYLGTSAGSNICGLSMQTTNDMPIVYPPSFKTLGMVPFNINPHFIDPDISGIHMGETRETRIKEFHVYNSAPVIGLREGSWLEVLGDAVKLKGNLPARLFKSGQEAVEMEPETDLSNLGR